MSGNSSISWQEIICIFILLVIFAGFSKAATIKPVLGADRFTYMTAASFDSQQNIKVAYDFLSEDGSYGIAEISGIASGHTDNSIDGTINVWLSIGPRERKASSDNPLPAWNIMLFLKPKQTPEQTAVALAAYINSVAEQPYYAQVYKSKVYIYYRSAFQAKKVNKSLKQLSHMTKKQVKNNFFTKGYSVGVMK